MTNLGFPDRNRCLRIRNVIIQVICASNSTIQQSVDYLDVTHSTIKGFKRLSEYKSVSRASADLCRNIEPLTTIRISVGTGHCRLCLHFSEAIS
jgi:hypothetical protein